MIKKIGYTFATVALAATAAVGGATSASAAHCVDEGGTSPGFSYFGSEIASGEREAKDTKGASTCRKMSGSPSERAPGRNR